MLINIPFYDKSENPDLKVDTWNGGLLLTMAAEVVGTDEDITIDVATPTGEVGVYWGSLENYIDDFSDYRVIHDYERKFSSMREHMEYLNDWGIPFGVADDLEQIMMQLSRYWFESERTFVLELQKIRKIDQPPHDGWRWHKWGEYIGTQDPQYDYLADEPHIDEVIIFEFLEIVPA